MRETTIHAQCGCSGKLVTSLRKSWCKPALRIECTAQSKGCNIARSKTVNLTRSCTLPGKSKKYQLSTAAVKLTGSIFLSGLAVQQFRRALRISGLSINNNHLATINKNFALGAINEFKEQQKYINKAYIAQKNTRVGIDTSFSQNRNAK